MFKFNSGKRSISFSDGKENKGGSNSPSSVSKKRKDKKHVKLGKNGAPLRSDFVVKISNK